MAQKIGTFLVLILMLSLMHPVHASGEEISVLQGNHFVIVLPDEDIVSATAQFHEKSWPFFRIKGAPRADEAITRGEFIGLLYQSTSLDDLQIKNPVEFPDLHSSHHFYAEILDAGAKGIISGYTNGNFGPYDSLSRAQAAKILKKSFSLIRSEDTVKSFPDLSADHDLYEDLQTAISAKVFQGYPDGLMRPDREIRIDEAKTLLKRLSNQRKFSIPERTILRAHIGVHRLWEAKSEPLTIVMNTEDKTRMEKNMMIHIQAQSFKTVRFSLSEQKEELLKPEYQDTTWAQINAAKTNPEPTQLWEGPFIVPTMGVETLGYGDKLYINGKYSGSHFGNDYANDEGTEITASNTGIITLSEWTDSYGNTMVIDHGQNIYTLYLHLSELIAEKGMTVKKGELIGRMGSTGVATGSHLHFTHFVGDVIVNPEEWFEKNEQ